MAAEVVMPKMGYDMTEGTVLRWLMSEGDFVEQGDILGEIETGKVNIEIEAFDAGVLRRILVAEGETVDVGTPIAVIAAEGEDIQDRTVGDGRSHGSSGEQRADAARAEEPADAGPARAAVSGHATDGGEAEVRPAEVDGLASGIRLRASPLARRLASEHNLDLAAIAGSGPSGRIVRDDVLAAIAGSGSVIDRRTGAPSTGGSSPAEAAEGTAPRSPDGPASQPEELSRMRATIARRLTGSWTTAPHIFLTMPIDVTDAIALRSQVNTILAERGEAKVSVNDIVLKAVAHALREHPGLNSSWIDGRRLTHERVNLGVAVALDDGLSTITVPDAESLSLAEIATVVADRSARARGGALNAADVEATSTFTVSNLGMFGVEEFTAILNPPEAGILAVGAATATPVVVGDEVVVRTVMRVTLSADHRVVDGAAAAEFLVTLRETLERPLALLVHAPSSSTG